MFGPESQIRELSEFKTNIAFQKVCSVHINISLKMAEEGNDLLNGLVAGYLAKVSPGISKKFKVCYQSFIFIFLLTNLSVCGSHSHAIKTPERVRNAPRKGLWVP